MPCLPAPYGAREPEAHRATPPRRSRGRRHPDSSVHEQKRTDPRVNWRTRRAQFNDSSTGVQVDSTRRLAARSNRATRSARPCDHGVTCDHQLHPTRAAAPSPRERGGITVRARRQHPANAAVARLALDSHAARAHSTARSSMSRALSRPTLRGGEPPTYPAPPQPPGGRGRASVGAESLHRIRLQSPCHTSWWRSRPCPKWFSANGLRSGLRVWKGGARSLETTFGWC